MTAVNSDYLAYKAAFKFEIRSTKHETNPKYESSNVLNNTDYSYKSDVLVI